LAVAWRVARASMAFPRAVRTGDGGIMVVLLPCAATRRGVACGAGRQTQCRGGHSPCGPLSSRTTDLATLDRRNPDRLRNSRPGYLMVQEFLAGPELYFTRPIMTPNQTSESCGSGGSPCPSCAWYPTRRGTCRWPP